MVQFTQKGDFKKLTSWFERVKDTFDVGILDKYGRIGVERLKEFTPKDTGETANSWYYETSYEKGVVKLEFFNSNIVDDWCNVAIILQYGHATGTGGYVTGIDYINPALKPVFEDLAAAAWKEVKKR